MEKRSLSATLAAGIGVASFALVLLGPALIHLGVLAPIVGFQVFALGALPGMLLALVLGIVGLARTRAQAGRSGRGRAWLGTSLGLLLFLVLAFGTGPAVNAPAIHDVTTNIEDPPQFSDAVKNAEGRRNGVAYPDGGEGVPELQRKHFPDLAPIRLDQPPEGAFERAERAARELGWTVTRSEPERGKLEAYDVTAVFQFVDDVVVRVRPDPSGSGSVVDVRSNSRVGGGDLAANAERIRAFQRELRAG